MHARGRDIDGSLRKRQLDAFVQLGKLTPAQASSLRDPVQAVIDSMNG